MNAVLYLKENYGQTFLAVVLFRVTGGHLLIYYHGSQLELILIHLL